MWLLDRITAAAMQAAISAGIVPNPEQQEMWAARRAESGSTSRLLSVGGDVATIEVSGVLTPQPDFFAWFFGGGNTTYGEIQAAIAEAESDTRVKSVDFLISSPGGAMSGLFETIGFMQEMKKPTRAVVTDMAASAAYGLAVQADKVIATNQATRFGSIGVISAFSVDPERVVVSSSNAPNKAPDVTTEEGRAIVQRELDAMHEVFAGAIATGRGVSLKTVNERFGQGATLLAQDAQERGMIDAIGAPIRVKSTTTTRGKGGEKQGAKTMDLATLKANHPDVYAAVVQEGVQAGIAQERDRVCAHLVMGKQSGAMDTALEAVQKGEAMTATYQATYMAAGMNRQSQGDMAADDAATGAVVDGAAPTGSDEKPAEDERDEAVTAAVEKLCGVAPEPVKA